MNKKWYISAVVVVLAFLGGIVTQEHHAKPNQEIVMQFTSSTVYSSDADDAIAIIKDQLESAGVHNIQVSRFDDGQLKIAYHSSAEVSDIKQILTETKQLLLDQTSSEGQPSEKPTKPFDLDVYEIQTAYEADLDIQGTSNPNPKGDQEQLVQTNPFALFKSNTFKSLDVEVNTSYKFYSNNRVSSNRIAYVIPEVRAGPLC